MLGNVALKIKMTVHAPGVCVCESQNYVEMGRTNILLNVCENDVDQICTDFLNADSILIIWSLAKVSALCRRNRCPAVLYM